VDSKCESLQTPHVSPKHRRGTAHDWPSSRLAFRHPFQSFERVRVFANEQHQCGGLRIGFSTALFPFLQGSFVDPQLARKDRSREAQFLARVPDQLRINLGERRWINFVAAQGELPSRWPFIAARPSISSPKILRLAIIVASGRFEFSRLREWCSLIRERAKHAIIASQGTRGFARLAQILRCAKNALLRITIKLYHYRAVSSFGDQSWSCYNDHD